MLDDFFLRAIIAGICVALIAGPLGCFVIWRRLSYFGDTLSHASLLGVAVAILLETNFTFSIFVVSGAVSLFLIYLRVKTSLPSDALLGLLAHSVLAVGIVVLGFMTWVRIDLLSLLFGDILAVSVTDIWLIFFGGINVYLQEKSAFFRNTPWLIDRLLDTPSLLNSLSKFSASTSAKDLGSLTVSMLKGENGRQKKELEKLVQWLKNDYMPDIIQLTNSMFSGMAAQLKSQLNVPVICGFQGEDIFLDQLIEPYKSEAITLLRERTNDIDGFFASCNY